jgi:cytosine/adenosine deaminase-related metal-dependent hydrolase
VQAIAAQAYMEMLESGFTRVGEFHYLHHDADGRAVRRPRRDERAHRRCRRADRHRPDPAAGVLRPPISVARRRIRRSAA